MKQWTREERYRELKDASEIRELYDRIQTSVYRQLYHVQPMTGLSSDPNGFALHEGKYHLCYQWCPWGAVHGLKYMRRMPYCKSSSRHFQSSQK